MPDFESGPPRGPAMVEHILAGEPDYNPGMPRGMRRNGFDADGNPTTDVYYRVDTPTIGRNGTLELALQSLRAREQGNEVPTKDS